LRFQVAEQLINPFGEDDDDFEMNWIIDRNNQISLLVADDMFGQIPPLEKDIFFGEPPPDCLPYTKSAARSMSQPHLGSTADLRSGLLIMFLFRAVSASWHPRFGTCCHLISRTLMLVANSSSRALKAAFSENCYRWKGQPT